MRELLAGCISLVSRLRLPGRWGSATSFSLRVKARLGINSFYKISWRWWKPISLILVFRVLSQGIPYSDFSLLNPFTTGLTASVTTSGERTTVQINPELGVNTISRLSGISRNTSRFLLGRGYFRISVGLFMPCKTCRGTCVYRNPSS